MSSIENAVLLKSSDGLDILRVPDDAELPLDKAGIELGLKKLIASWKHRAPGHEKEPTAPIAFKYSVIYEAGSNLVVSGGLPHTKTWEKLASCFPKTEQRAIQLPPWELVIPPLTPLTVWSVVVPGRVKRQAVDPVIEVFYPEMASRTFGMTTFHFLREQDVTTFLEMTLQVLD